MEMSDEPHAPVALPPGKETIGQEAELAPEPFCKKKLYTVVLWVVVRYHITTRCYNADYHDINLHILNKVDELRGSSLQVYSF